MVVLLCRRPVCGGAKIWCCCCCCCCCCSCCCCLQFQNKMMMLFFFSYVGRRMETAIIQEIQNKNEWQKKRVEERCEIESKPGSSKDTFCWLKDSTSLTNHLESKADWSWLAHHQTNTCWALSMIGWHKSEAMSSKDPLSETYIPKHMRLEAVHLLEHQLYVLVTVTTIMPSGLFRD